MNRKPELAERELKIKKGKHGIKTASRKPASKE